MYTQTQRVASPPRPRTDSACSRWSFKGVILEQNIHARVSCARARWRALRRAHAALRAGGRALPPPPPLPRARACRSDTGTRRPGAGARAAGVVRCRCCVGGGRALRVRCGVRGLADGRPRAGHLRTRRRGARASTTPRLLPSLGSAAAPHAAQRAHSPLLISSAMEGVAPLLLIATGLPLSLFPRAGPAHELAPAPPTSAY